MVDKEHTLDKITNTHFLVLEEAEEAVVITEHTGLLEMAVLVLLLFVGHNVSRICDKNYQS